MPAKEKAKTETKELEKRLKTVTLYNRSGNKDSQLK